MRPLCDYNFTPIAQTAASRPKVLFIKAIFGKNTTLVQILAASFVVESKITPRFVFFNIGGLDERVT